MILIMYTLQRARPWQYTIKCDCSILFFHINYKQKYKNHFLIMGVSISKSTAYDQMVKKSKKKEESKSKDLYKKNIFFMEGHKENNQSSKQVKKLTIRQSIRVKHPIEKIVNAPEESIDIHVNMDEPQTYKKQKENLQQTSKHRQKLSSLKKSLHFQQKQFPEDDQNMNATEQFHKMEILNKKHTKPLSCFSIHTKNQTSTPVSTFDPYTSSANSIGSKAKQYASNPVSIRKMQPQFPSKSQWKIDEQSHINIKDYRKGGEVRFLALSNKFGEMGRHLHQRTNQQVRSRHIPTIAMIGSKHSPHFELHRHEA